MSVYAATVGQRVVKVAPVGLVGQVARTRVPNGYMLPPVKIESLTRR